MIKTFDKIQELLAMKADILARINLIPYDGAIEIKESSGRKYIYLRKKNNNKYKSTYVGVYSDNLFAAIAKLLKEKKEYEKQLRILEKKLNNLGYVDIELNHEVLLNIDFARINMKNSIYNQAILEGIATTFPDTETILENGKIQGMKGSDVQKILNLKHAWEFILDEGVISSSTNLSILSHVANLVNEGFYIHGGRLRNVPVSIGGTSYIPPLPIEADIQDEIKKIVNEDEDSVTIAIKLGLYCMKAQIFNDGNKRAAIIFANHYLISKGGGLIIVPEKEMSLFKRLLIDYYENNNETAIFNFMREKCWKKMK